MSRTRTAAGKSGARPSRRRLSPRPQPAAGDQEAGVGDADALLARAIAARAGQGKSLPDAAALDALEELIRRLLGAALLFEDLATGPATNDPPRPRGLVFLATSISREADRLYRLFHGHAPYP